MHPEDQDFRKNISVQQQKNDPAESNTFNAGKQKKSQVPDDTQEPAPGQAPEDEKETDDFDSGKRLPPYNS